MLIFHAYWEYSLPGRLHFWAETTDQTEANVLFTPVDNTNQDIRSHPFAASTMMLQASLSDILGLSLEENTASQERIFRLPSTALSPLPSPGLGLQVVFAQDSEHVWRKWSIPTLSFSPVLLFDVLLHLSSFSSHTTQFGQSVHYWSLAAQFACELITRHAFSPVLHETNSINTFHVTWEPTFSNLDRKRFTHLVKAMPPVCCSPFSIEDHSSLLNYTLLQDFLTTWTDSFIRASLNQTFPYLTAYHVEETTPCSLQQCWIQAVTSQHPLIHIASDEQDAFSALLSPWLSIQDQTTHQHSLCTCMKLETPEQEDTSSSDLWGLHFYLQARDDPTVLIPADSIWQESSPLLLFLSTFYEDPQQRLLTDLGNAAKLFPLLKEALQSTFPHTLAMTTERVLSFIRDAVPLLKNQGVIILIPPWWGNVATRVRTRLHVSLADEDLYQDEQQKSLLGMNSLLSFRRELVINDMTLTPEEFTALVHLKQPLVYIRGQWIELSVRDISCALDFVEKYQAQHAMTLGEMLRLRYGESSTSSDSFLLEITTQGALNDVLKRLFQHEHLQCINPPSTFQGQLRPYQLWGFSWMTFLIEHGFGACLADDMGLGKTCQTIALLLHHKRKQEQTASSYSVLLICPMSIIGNWQRELRRFAPSLRVFVHHGTSRLSDEALRTSVQQNDIIITTYALTVRDQSDLSTLFWDIIVIDEAQNIKNEAAKQTQAIKSLHAAHRIALTGTPVENHLSDLWSIMDFLNPGYLGSSVAFNQSFVQPISHENENKKTELKHLIRPFLLRRLKTDTSIIYDLPEKQEFKVFCNLTQEQATLYSAVVEETLATIGRFKGRQRGMALLASFTKLKQVCDHPALFMGDRSTLFHRSGKLNRLQEMIEEVLSVHEQAIIFTQFVEMGMMIQQTLQNLFHVKVLFLHGDTPKKERDWMIQHFQDSFHYTPLFVLSLKAGGVGINMTAATHVFHFDRWWNPAVENQATDRAFRIGQTHDVQVHKLLCAGTLEERIDQLLESKQNLADSLIGSGESWLTDLSTTYLRELLTLGNESIGDE